MKARIIFFIILISGIGLRLYYALNAPFAVPQIIPDSATLWLMAKHITAGEFPIFFYGQYYVGPVEPLAIALFFKIFGIKISTLFLGNIFYSALFIISSYFLGKELKNRAVGLLMMIFSAFPSVYFFHASIMPAGYWIEILLIGNLLLILTLKIPDLPLSAKKALYYLLLGVFAGIGFWTQYIILYYLLAVFVYLLINEKWKHMLKCGLLTVIGFFVSALPFWIFTIKHNFATFQFNPQGKFQLEILKLLDLLKNSFIHMFSMGFNYNTSYEKMQLATSILLCLSIIVFIFGPASRRKFIFNKVSLIVYLFFSIILFFILFKTNVKVGKGGYNYLISIFTVGSVIFAYAVSFMYEKTRIIGICFFLIIPFNIWNTYIYIQKDIARSPEIGEAIYDRLEFFRDNNIYRYVGTERESRTFVFFSNEEVIATAFTDSEYQPYQDIVEASDTIAFDERRHLWTWGRAFKNISPEYTCKNGYFYDFKPFPYKTESILPQDWKVYSNCNNNFSKTIIDRNFQSIWTRERGMEDDAVITIDLGNSYTICKVELYNAHHYANYPGNCKIETSINGKKWTENFYNEYIQALFWSGPRPYWHHIDGRAEMYFKPVKARYVRLTEKGEGTDHPWEINEIFIYKYLGKKEYVTEDFSTDIEDINRFLGMKGINFVYADYWPSAKIREISGSTIEALVPYSAILPKRPNMSRDVTIGKDRAFIVRKENKEEVVSILDIYELPYKTKEFKYYICYYFDDLNRSYESLSSLVWIGTGLVQNDKKASGQWFYKKGVEMQRLGGNKEALAFYKRAVKECPNNYLAYKALAGYGIPKYKNIIKRKFTPDKKINIGFANGMELAGFTIRDVDLRKLKGLERGNTYDVEYYWTAEETIEDNIVVFVHFVKDGKIVFQNDYEILPTIRNPLIAQREEIFRKRLKLHVPLGIQTGSYEMILGLWDNNKKKRIYIKDKKHTRKSKVEIAEVMVY